MCNHLWTYRAGRSECLRCRQTADDLRGLPYGHYPVNGCALTAGQLRVGYACPLCLRDVNPRVVLGELRILCAGPRAHDVVALGRAVPKGKRDYIVERQRMDAVDALYGLKGVLNMPILDLQKDAPARLKRAGIIRLGYKKTNAKGKEYPVAADHFVLKDAPGLAEVYKKKPTRLNVYLPFNEVDRNFPAWHQHWVAGGLLCRGDGQRVEYAIIAKTGQVIVKGGKALASGTFDGIKATAGHPIKCPGMAHDLYPRCKKCRPNALLIILIREVDRLAYFQVATSSIHNIVNLTGQMKWVKENLGKLQGVPFILELRPDKISTPGAGGKRVRREKYLLHLEPDPEWVKAMLAEMHQRALPGAQRLALPPGAGDDAVDAEIVTEVADLGDDLLWEPVEHHNGNGGGNEKAAEAQPKTPPAEPQRPARETKSAASDNGHSPGTLPTIEAITAKDVARARKTTTDQGTPLGGLPQDKLEFLKGWLEFDEQRIAKRPKLANGVAVLLDPRAAALQPSGPGWSLQAIGEILLEKLAANTDEAITMLERSQVVGPSDAEDVLVGWVKAYRSVIAGGASEEQAAKDADLVYDVPF